MERRGDRSSSLIGLASCRGTSTRSPNRRPRPTTAPAMAPPRPPHRTPAVITPGQRPHRPERLRVVAGEGPVVAGAEREAHGQLRDDDARWRRSRSGSVRTSTPSTAVTTSAAPTSGHGEPWPPAFELVPADDQHDRHPRPRQPPERGDAGEQPPDQRILASRSPGSANAATSRALAPGIAAPRRLRRSPSRDASEASLFDADEEVRGGAGQRDGRRACRRTARAPTTASSM